MGTETASTRAEAHQRTTELATAARDGDQEAFASLVAEVWPGLVAFARSVLGRTGEAEDVVQDALVVAWNRLADLRAAERFYPWVRKIVFRRAVSLLKRRASLAPIEAASHHAIYLVPSEVDVPRLLAVLTPQQRAVVYLSFVEGLTNAEIRAALGVSAVTVRIYRARAVARLRRHLGVELP